MGGLEDTGKMKADYIYRFYLLPRIPLYLCFWAADEEFPASCKLFLDSSAEAYIDIEYLAYLVERFVELFIKLALTQMDTNSNELYLVIEQIRYALTILIEKQS